MKKSRKTTQSKLNISIAITALMIVFVFCSPFITYAQNANLSNNVPEIEEELIIDQTQPLKEFSTAFQAISYAQSKLATATNITSHVNANIQFKANMLNLTIPAQLKSVAVVDKQGRIHTVDACNCFEKWVDGQYAIETYGSYEGDNAYARATVDVTYDTCQATFTRDFDKMPAEQAIKNFGYISNLNLSNVQEDNILNVGAFKKEEDYVIDVKLNANAIKGISQKIYKCAKLAAFPTIISCKATYTIDEYGNMKSVQYKLQYSVQKELKMFNKKITAILTADVTQIYTNSGANNFEIPSSVNL